MLYVVTLAEMKAELGIPTDDVQDDAALTLALEGWQSRLDVELNRTLLSGTVTEIHDGGTQAIYVDRWPIQAVSEIRYAPDRDWTAVAPMSIKDFFPRISEIGRGRIEYRDGASRWPGNAQCVRVIYTGGYIPCDGTPGAGEERIPATIRTATFMQVGYEWRNRKSLGVTSMSAQGVSVNLAPANLLPGVKEMLSDYRRI